MEIETRLIKQATEVRQASLVRAAMRLAAQRSPADITTADLAHAVGISQGAVFRHFPSKQAIWLAGLDWATQTLLTRLQDAAARAGSEPSIDQSPLHALQAIFAAHVDFVTEHPGVPRVIFQELQHPQDTALKARVRDLMQQYRMLVMAQLQRAQTDHLLAPDTDLQAACVLFLGAVQGLVMQSMVAGQVHAMAEQASDVFAIYLRGIARSTPIHPESTYESTHPMDAAHRHRCAGHRTGCRASLCRAAHRTPGTHQGHGHVGTRRQTQPRYLRHRHGRSPTQLDGRPHDGRSRAKRAGGCGRHGKAGQLLAEMDPVDLDQRLAALDAALARAASTQAGAQAQVADATARRELAALNAKRNQDLAAQNFISPGALEGRLQEKASADAALQAAQANLNGSAQDITRQKAERAALQQQRGNVRLLAPSDGVVTSRDAEAGSTVVAGQPVLRLIDPASIWVRMRVDQGRSAGLVPGLKARVVIRSQPQAPLQGQVARVELLADAVTEERIAQVAFAPTHTDTPAATATVGELAEVELQLPETASSLLLPNASIQRLQGKTGVWRLSEGKPAFVPVRLGTSSLDGRVQVLEGLKSGDSVVVYSQKALTEGVRVQVVDALVKGSTP
jgi:HlyD family secretion protein